MVHTYKIVTYVAEYFYLSLIISDNLIIFVIQSFVFSVNSFHKYESISKENCKTEIKFISDCR